LPGETGFFNFIRSLLHAKGAGCWLARSTQNACNALLARVLVVLVVACDEQASHQGGTGGLWCGGMQEMRRG
jgi:hypothetical protein